MAIIVMHPAHRSRSSRTSPGLSGRYLGVRGVLIAVAAPALAVALSWGMVDALAFTQNSLMGLYAAASSIVA